MQPTQTLNLALQQKDKLISDFSETALKWKLQTDVITRSFNHFPHLKSTVNTFLKVYDQKLENTEIRLLHEFKSQI
jgi:hypothetical protein